MSFCRTISASASFRSDPGVFELVARVGDEVVAQDGSLGRVDRVIRFETRDPESLVVAVGRGLVARYPVVPCSLVTGVDRLSRRIHLRGRRTCLRRLPESLPIVV
ncbi:MAG TPA: hypothetical protein VMN35_08830 [Gaiellaceae bacterium]|nr:hypothetical protein [Gaiellaceae bacterium]